ncbi:hypothetical protein LO771_28720 [Streptacidiphilus sp. ASG 303]|uniref:hypothetical protein n=1 Tax=Streptacidiphilus sp. ASG 303 TaxID=2896847 RepID=UPI001E37863A|nr:hypothetical protein [Streptacidiphilus sp. ASG 303]MCD0486259.1 hypothetical protein [Streptacidiphilus sp. ASG 303]
MTDNPGWAPPGSPEPPREDGRPQGGASAPGGVPGPSAPQDARPADAGPQDTAPPAQDAPGRGAAPGWGTPPPGPHPGAPYPGGPYPPPPPFAGGWAVPLAPKPGVIPLRPLGVGEILDGAVSTARRYWRTVLGISLTLAVLSSASSVLVQWGTRSDTLSPAADAAGTAVDYLVLLLAGQVATALLTVVVGRGILGRPVSLREAWADARPRLLPLLGLVLLLLLMVVAVGGVLLAPGIAAAASHADPAVLGVSLGLGLLAATACIVWLWIRFSLAAPALMLEKQGVFASLSRSARLVRGSWWRIFGITLLGLVVSWVISTMILLPFTVVGLFAGGIDAVLNPQADSGPPLLTLVMLGIGSAVATTLTLPFTSGINVLLYVDQRIRREALDIELARAAGLPGFGEAPAAAGA